MSKLDMDSLNDLVDTSLKQKVKYFDYPTECKLRKLLHNEHGDGHDGQDAREHLRSHREFYKEWAKSLFGDVQFAPPVIVFPNVTEAVEMTATSNAIRCTSEIFGLVCGIIIYILVY